MQECKYPLELCKNRVAVRGNFMCENDYCVLKDKAPKKTYADWIRAMTDEELATFLVRFGMCQVCDYNHTNCQGSKCHEGYLRWLQREKSNSGINSI